MRARGSLGSRCGYLSASTRRAGGGPQVRSWSPARQHAQTLLTCCLKQGHCSQSWQRHSPGLSVNLKGTQGRPAGAGAGAASPRHCPVSARTPPGTARRPAAPPRPARCPCGPCRSRSRRCSRRAPRGLPASGTSARPRWPPAAAPPPWAPRCQRGRQARRALPLPSPRRSPRGAEDRGGRHDDLPGRERARYPGKRQPGKFRETAHGQDAARQQRPARAMGRPRTPWSSFYRSGDTGRSTGALTAHPARSVHEGCASVARRGTNLLAGRGTARTATAGTRPPSGERADGGLRTGRGPGTGEATPTHAPAGPFTRHGGLARPFPDDLPPAPCSAPGMKAALACAGTGTVHARKGDCLA